MGDEFDGCECVWSPEFAMQRLLNFIRQNQDYCTDTECIDVSGRVAPQSDSLVTIGNDDGANNYLMVTLCLALAVIMFFVRPGTIMNMTGTKPRRQRHHDNNDDAQPPPPPPPAIH